MIDEACLVFYFKLHKLKNLRHFSSQDTNLMLVKCFIISRLDYGNSLYFCCPQYLVNKLHKVLNACIRYIYDVPVYNHTALYTFFLQCHVLPLKYRIKLKLCLMVSLFKILNSLSPTYLNKLFKIYLPFCDNLQSASDYNKTRT